MALCFRIICLCLFLLTMETHSSGSNESSSRDLTGDGRVNEVKSDSDSAAGNGKKLTSTSKSGTGLAPDGSDPRNQMAHQRSRDEGSKVKVVRSHHMHDIKQLPEMTKEEAHAIEENHKLTPDLVQNSALPARRHARNALEFSIKRIKREITDLADDDKAEMTGEASNDDDFESESPAEQALDDEIEEEEEAEKQEAEMTSSDDEASVAQGSSDGTEMEEPQEDSESADSTEDRSTIGMLNRAVKLKQSNVESVDDVSDDEFNDDETTESNDDDNIDSSEGSDGLSSSESSEVSSEDTSDISSSSSEETSDDDETTWFSLSPDTEESGESEYGDDISTDGSNEYEKRSVSSDLSKKRRIKRHAEKRADKDEDGTEVAKKDERQSEEEGSEEKDGTEVARKNESQSEEEDGDEKDGTEVTRKDESQSEEEDSDEKDGTEVARKDESQSEEVDSVEKDGTEVTKKYETQGEEEDSDEKNGIEVPRKDEMQSEEEDSEEKDGTEVARKDESQNEKEDSDEKNGIEVPRKHESQSEEEGSEEKDGTEKPRKDESKSEEEDGAEKDGIEVPRKDESQSEEEDSEEKDGTEVARKDESQSEDVDSDEKDGTEVPRINETQSEEEDSDEKDGTEVARKDESQSEDEGEDNDEKDSKDKSNSDDKDEEDKEERKDSKDDDNNDQEGKNDDDQKEEDDDEEEKEDDSEEENNEKDEQNNNKEDDNGEEIPRKDEDKGSAPARGYVQVHPSHIGLTLHMVNNSVSLKNKPIKAEIKIVLEPEETPSVPQSEDTAVRWTSWSTWGGCSVSCGQNGVQPRSRKCIAPPCTGDGAEKRQCYRQPVCTAKPTQAASTKTAPPVATSPASVAPPPGVWSTWSKWSHCSVTCGLGAELQRRECPSSSSVCTGASSRTRHCIKDACKPVDSAAPVQGATGHAVKLECVYNHKVPVKEVYWITPKGHKITTSATDPRYAIRGKHLYIWHAKDHDEGTYHCVVVKRTGRVITGDATLHVNSCQARNICLNGGTCASNSNSPDKTHFTCFCHSGYSGNRCENKDDNAIIVVIIVLMSLFGVSQVVIVAILYCKKCDSISPGSPTPQRKSTLASWFRRSNNKKPEGEESAPLLVENPGYDDEEADQIYDLADRVYDYAGYGEDPIPGFSPDYPDDSENLRRKSAPGNMCLDTPHPRKSRRYSLPAGDLAESSRIKNLADFPPLYHMDTLPQLNRAPSVGTGKRVSFSDISSHAAGMEERREVFDSRTGSWIVISNANLSQDNQDSIYKEDRGYQQPQEADTDPLGDQEQFYLPMDGRRNVSYSPESPDKIAMPPNSPERTEHEERLKTGLSPRAAPLMGKETRAATFIEMADGHIVSPNLSPRVKSMRSKISQYIRTGPAGMVPNNTNLSSPNASSEIPQQASESFPSPPPPAYSPPKRPLSAWGPGGNIPSGPANMPRAALEELSDHLLEFGITPEGSLAHIGLPSYPGIQLFRDGQDENMNNGNPESEEDVFVEEEYDELGLEDSYVHETQRGSAVTREFAEEHAPVHGYLSPHTDNMDEQDLTLRLNEID